MMPATITKLVTAISQPITPSFKLNRETFCKTGALRGEGLSGFFEEFGLITLSQS
jgi:hypothetical protein